jgi:hypothetical protein
LPLTAFFANQFFSKEFLMIRCFATGLRCGGAAGTYSARAVADNQPVETFKTA